MTVCAVATADACWAADDLSALETLSDLIQDAHERFTPGINMLLHLLVSDIFR